MIKKLLLKNFQSHKRSLLEFETGLNVIVGESDKGKSSIIRALRHLAFNTARGDQYISHWAKEFSITVTTSEGDKIKRLKGKRNEYHLNDSVYKAFGTKVPEAVEKALNLNPTNIQSQRDGDFLLSESSGKVADHFNKVANLDVIDNSTNYVNGEISKINKMISHHDLTIKENKERLSEFEYLDEEVGELKRLEGRFEMYVNNISKIDSLEKLIANIENITELESKWVREVKPLKIIEPILSKFKQVESNGNLIHDLRELVDKIDDLAELISSEGINKTKLSVINRLISLRQQQELIEADYDDIGLILDKLNRLSDEVKLLKKEFGEKEKEYHDNYPKQCPFCNK